MVLTFEFPPDFLFSLASLDSFPPGEAIGCCRTRGFIDSLRARMQCVPYDEFFHNNDILCGKN